MGGGVDRGAQPALTVHPRCSLGGVGGPLALHHRSQDPPSHVLRPHRLPARETRRHACLGTTSVRTSRLTLRVREYWSGELGSTFRRWLGGTAVSLTISAVHRQLPRWKRASDQRASRREDSVELRAWRFTLAVRCGAESPGARPQERPRRPVHLSVAASGSHCRWRRRAALAVLGPLLVGVTACASDAAPHSSSSDFRSGLQPSCAAAATRLGFTVPCPSIWYSVDGTELGCVERCLFMSEALGGQTDVFACWGHRTSMRSVTNRSPNPSRFDMLLLSLERERWRQKHPARTPRRQERSPRMLTLVSRLSTFSVARQIPRPVPSTVERFIGGTHWPSCYLATPTLG